MAKPKKLILTKEWCDEMIGQWREAGEHAKMIASVNADAEEYYRRDADCPCGGLPGHLPGGIHCRRG